jgi:hypothetical protein
MIRQRVKAKAARQAPAAKPGRGWVGLNIAARKVQALRAMCEIWGIPFRLFCEHAIVAARSKMEEGLGVSAHQLAGMSEPELERLRARAELLRKLESSRLFTRQRGQNN